MEEVVATTSRGTADIKERFRSNSRYRWVIFTSNFAAPKRLDGKGAFSNISCSNGESDGDGDYIPIHDIICIPR
ncbi:hypothetical protein PV326_009696 [Microctonus aethiopoides]|nr:hypothetical protein PV326_009696 [Microctonus aethiopoides]